MRKICTCTHDIHTDTTFSTPYIPPNILSHGWTGSYWPKLQTNFLWMCTKWSPSCSKTNVPHGMQKVVHFPPWGWLSLQAGRCRWLVDFGAHCHHFELWIVNFEFWILNFEFWIFEFWIFKFRVFIFRILEFWILKIRIFEFRIFKFKMFIFRIFKFRISKL